jgi:hypothetical protein
MLFFLSALLVTFTPQIVSTLEFQISQVKQCEPVSITLVGDSNADDVPMWLTLIPFNSHPVSIQLPNATANMSGVNVTFFPFNEGTSFVASLDDVNGNSTAKVSGIINVLPSPTSKTTCLPQVQNTTSLFTLSNNISQCQEFNVTYNQSTFSKAPSIRLFNPQGPSFRLNLTADDQGTATYLMDFDQGEKVVLLIDGGHRHQETSPLTTSKRSFDLNDAKAHST